MNEGESGLKTEKYKYVIIGGGTAGHAALVAILQNDVPYSRPPLSKDLWNSEDPNVAANLKLKIGRAQNLRMSIGERARGVWMREGVKARILTVFIVYGTKG